MLICSLDTQSVLRRLLRINHILKSYDHGSSNFPILSQISWYSFWSQLYLSYLNLIVSSPIDQFSNNEQSKQQLIKRKHEMLIEHTPSWYIYSIASMNDLYASISITFFELPPSLKLGLINSSNFSNVQSNMLPLQKTCLNTPGLALTVSSRFIRRSTYAIWSIIGSNGWILSFMSIDLLYFHGKSLNIQQHNTRPLSL